MVIKLNFVLIKFTSINNLTISTCSSQVTFNSILSCFSHVGSFDSQLLQVISNALVFEES